MFILFRLSRTRSSQQQGKRLFNILTLYLPLDTFVFRNSRKFANNTRTRGSVSSVKFHRSTTGTEIRSISIQTRLISRTDTESTIKIGERRPDDAPFAAQRQRLTERTESTKLKFYSRVTGPRRTTR